MRHILRAGSTTPIGIHPKETVQLDPSSDAIGTVSVPGEGVTQALPAGGSAAFGGYLTRRDVVIVITQGTCDVRVSATGSPALSGGQGSAVATDTVAADALGVMRLGSGYPVDLSSSVDLSGTYVTVSDNMPSSIPAFDNPNMTTGSGSIHFYDPVNGNDANTGNDPSAPWKTLKQASTNNNDIILQKRGTTYVDQGTAAAVDMSNRFLGAYGDPSLPMPVFRGLSVDNTVPCMIKWSGGGGVGAGGAADILFDGSDATIPRHTAWAHCFSAGQNINNLKFLNCKFTGSKRNGASNSSWYDGLLISSTFGTGTTALTPSSNILVQNCESYGNDGHGFQARGAFGVQDGNGVYRGIDYIGCSSHDNGQALDAHGFTAYSAYPFTIDSAGVSGWTNTSGTIYWCSAAGFANTSSSTSPNGYAQVPQIDGLFVRIPLVAGGGTGYTTCILRQNTATPTTPGVGEYGFDPATQRIYINANTAPTAPSNWGLQGYVFRTKGMRYWRSKVANMKALGLSSFGESHGFVFDDGVSFSSVYDCDVDDVDGAAVSINNGSFNEVWYSRLRNFKHSAIKTGFGEGNRVERSYLASKWIPSGLNSAYIIDGRAGEVDNSLVNSTLKRQIWARLTAVNTNASDQVRLLASTSNSRTPRATTFMCRTRNMALMSGLGAGAGNGNAIDFGRSAF